MLKMMLYNLLAVFIYDFICKKNHQLLEMSPRITWIMACLSPAIHRKDSSLCIIEDTRLAVVACCGVDGTVP